MTESTEIRYDATVRCPHCGHRRAETMPADACLVLHDCRRCGALLRPRPGDCCIFCSFGDRACPPVQATRNAAAARR